jgi:hypothetical protein
VEPIILPSSQPLPRQPAPPSAIAVRTSERKRRPGISPAARQSSLSPNESAFPDFRLDLGFSAVGIGAQCSPEILSISC